MTVPSLPEEPGRVDEPRVAEDYADVLSQVVAAGRPLIVRRNGEDLAAVIPLEYLVLVREILARQEVETLAAQLDWDRSGKSLRPPQSWFDDDNPFETRGRAGVVTPIGLPQLGSVGWAEVEDANGYRKLRPVVVVTPTAEIAAGKSVRVVAITTRLPDPLPEDHVLLPWERQGKAPRA